jgi:hypothetical protein
MTAELEISSDDAVGRSSGLWTALAGFAFVVLMVVAFGPLGNTLVPGEPDAVREYTDYYADSSHQEREMLSGGAVVLAAFSFGWFLHGLRVMLRDAERRDGGLSALSFAGGVIFAALLLVDNAVRVIVGATLKHSDAYRFDANAAMLLDNLAYWLLGAGLVGSALMISGASAIARRQRLFPGWLVWGGFLVALGTLVGLVQTATDADAARAWGGGQGDHGWLIATGIWVLVVSARMISSSRSQ